MVLVQQYRPVSLTTPLGTDVLAFHHMVATEGLGRLFRLEIEALSEDNTLDLSQLLGQPITVTMDLGDDRGKRHFNGLVSRAAYLGQSGRHGVYSVTAYPWMWILTRFSDCRIFQNKTAPDIITQVFRDRGFTDFELKLEGSFEEREYCVQYRETDFNFVSRLMEEEGIYYFFKHEMGRHMAVLGNAPSSHEPMPHYAEIPYFPPDPNALRERDHVYECSVAKNVQSARYALKDFWFEEPRRSLLSEKPAPRSHPYDTTELFDYPGGYSWRRAVEAGRGDRLVRIRVQEQYAQHEHVVCRGTVRGVVSGALTSLTRHPRDDQNREYLVVEAVNVLSSDKFETGGGIGGEPFTCEFTAMPISLGPYRPPRITPKPVVQGTQTAIVVGPDGEEIWTDKHGRVKVQFHWDREGRNDENSSCWIRVSQPWAGKSWGAMFLPRIGHEVIVDFLEGDPDQPIIIGRVYNGDNKTPYELPGKAPVSTFKSDTTKGGGGSNELRFDDTKGAEEVYLHAQKDQVIVVENDETITVKNNRTETVEKGNDKVTIEKGNRSIKVTIGSSTLEAGTSIELKVGANSIKIDQSGITLDGLTMTIKGQTTTMVQGAQTTVQGSANLTLTGGTIAIG